MNSTPTLALHGAPPLHYNYTPPSPDDCRSTPVDPLSFLSPCKSIALQSTNNYNFYSSASPLSHNLHHLLHTPPTHTPPSATTHPTLHSHLTSPRKQEAYLPHQRWPVARLRLQRPGGSTSGVQLLELCPLSWPQEAFSTF